MLWLACSEHQVPEGLGWLSAATSFGAVVGPGFGSLFIEWWGHRGPGFGAAGFCALSGLFAWLFLKESRGMRLSAELEAATTAETERPVRLSTETSTLWRVVKRAGDPISPSATNAATRRSARSGS